MTYMVSVVCWNSEKVLNQLVWMIAKMMAKMAKKTLTLMAMEMMMTIAEVPVNWLVQYPDPTEGIRIAKVDM